MPAPDAYRLNEPQDTRRQFWKHGKHPDDCECTRCTGFQPGHKLSAGENHRGGMPAKTGVRLSPLKLKPVADEMANIVRPLMPVPGPAFEGTLQAYCMLLARLQRCHELLEACQDRLDADEYEDTVVDGEVTRTRHEKRQDDEIVLDKIETNIRRWTNSTLRHEDQLGLTPRSAAAILRDVKGGDRNPFRPPSQEELGAVSRDKLYELRDALSRALEPEEYYDGEIIE